MLTIHKLRGKARAFVEGVCKVSAQLDLLLEAIERHDPQGWQASARGKQQSIEALESVLAMRDHELSAKREAHEETTNRLDRLIVESNQLRVDGYRLQSELSAARADLEALTEWSAIQALPADLPPNTVVLYAMTDNPDGATLERPAFLRTLLFPERYIWRHTPESLAAWKAREGGRGRMKTMPNNREPKLAPGSRWLNDTQLYGKTTYRVNDPSSSRNVGLLHGYVHISDPFSGLCMRHEDVQAAIRVAKLDPVFDSAVALDVCWCSLSVSERDRLVGNGPLRRLLDANSAAVKGATSDD